MSISINDIQVDESTLRNAEFATKVIPADEAENYLQEQGYREEAVKDALSVSGQAYVGI